MKMKMKEDKIKF